jgi:modulator of FtsH protease
MAPFDPSAWSAFFVATAGAGAALAGLVFVSISINLEKIVKYPGLVSRAAEAMTLLMAVVVVGILGSAPNTPGALGWELTVLGLGIWAVITVLAIDLVRGWRTDPGRRAAVPQRILVQRLVLAAIAPIAIFAAGVSTATGAGIGLQWLAIAVPFALVAGVLDAWVLLVEIVR